MHYAHYARWVTRKSRFNDEQWSTPSHQIAPLAELHFCGRGKCRLRQKSSRAGDHFAFPWPPFSSEVCRWLQPASCCHLPLHVSGGDMVFYMCDKLKLLLPDRVTRAVIQVVDLHTTVDVNSKWMDSVQGWILGYRCRTFSRKCCPLAVRNRLMYFCRDLDAC